MSDQTDLEIKPKLSRMTIKMAIKALTNYQREFYGWNCRIHEDDRMSWERYERAINELEELLKVEENDTR